MIVITSLNTKIRNLKAGDLFRLSVHDVQGKGNVVEEVLTEDRVIDYMCSYRFTKKDGTCTSFHLSGFFGHSANLPQEMKEAVMLEDLTSSQRKNLEVSCGTKLE